MPVYVRDIRGHDWFYRKNRNLLPLSYGEVWARLDQIGSLIWRCFVSVDGLCPEEGFKGVWVSRSIVVVVLVGL